MSHLEGCCKNCYFYVRQACHLQPPVRLPRKFDPKAIESLGRHRIEEVIWGWPEVREIDWCGQYRYKGH